MSSENETPPAPFLVALLRDLYLAPSEAFTQLARRPLVAPALVGFLLVQATFLAVWMSRVDMLAFIRNQAEAAGRPAPPAGALDPSALGAFQWISALTGMAAGQVILLACAGLLLFVFSFVLGAAVRFKQALAVVAWSTLATSLVTTPLLLLVMALRGEWNVAPDQVIAANLGAWLDQRAAGPFFYSLAGSLDVFVLWLLVLVSLGMARVARVATGTSTVAVLILWLLFVLVKAALAAAL